MTETSFRCAFCRKEKGAVESLVYGPGVQICNECVAFSLGAIRDPEATMPTETGVSASGATGQVTCSFCSGSPYKGRVISGPGVNICGECIDICDDILNGEPIEPFEERPIDGPQPSVLDEVLRTIEKDLLSTPDGRNAMLGIAELMGGKHAEETHKKITAAVAADPDGRIAAAAEAAARERDPAHRAMSAFSRKERELKERRDALRFEAETHGVTATVDGNFRLRRMSIPLEVAGETSLEQLGESVVEAYNTALGTAERELEINAMDPDGAFAGITTEDLEELRRSLVGGLGIGDPNGMF